MNTGILLITHDKIGPDLLETAEKILKQQMLNVEVLVAPIDCDADALLLQAQHMVSSLNHGQGVLVLNDVYGATPFNIARQLQSSEVQVLSGLNLNMLLRAINYQSCPVTELAEKAREGGITGVRYAE